MFPDSGERRYLPPHSSLIRCALFVIIPFRFVAALLRPGYVFARNICPLRTFLSPLSLTDTHRPPARPDLSPLLQIYRFGLLLSCMYLTAVSCGMFQGYGQVAACGSDLRRGRTRKHGTPQAGTDGNGASQPVSCPTRYFLFQPSARGAIRGNVRQSPTQNNSVKINALSWHPNVKITLMKTRSLPRRGITYCPR